MSLLHFGNNSSAMSLELVISFALQIFPISEWVTIEELKNNLSRTGVTFYGEYQQFSQSHS